VALTLKIIGVAKRRPSQYRTSALPFYSFCSWAYYNSWRVHEPGKTSSLLSAAIIIVRRQAPLAVTKRITSMIVRLSMLVACLDDGSPAEVVNSLHFSLPAPF